jgi:hypothetical protein
VGHRPGYYRRPANDQDAAAADALIMRRPLTHP